MNLLMRFQVLLTAATQVHGDLCRLCSSNHRYMRNAGSHGSTIVLVNYKTHYYPRAQASRIM